MFLTPNFELNVHGIASPGLAEKPGTWHTSELAELQGILLAAVFEMLLAGTVRQLPTCKEGAELDVDGIGSRELENDTRGLTAGMFMLVKEGTVAFPEETLPVTVVDGKFTVIEGTFIAAKGTLTVVEGTLVLYNELSTAVDGMFILVKGTFSVVEETFTVVDGIFTLLEETLTLLEATFTDIEG